MSSFDYMAKDRTGKTIKGTVEAETQEEVLRYIKEKSYYPVKIEEQKKGLTIEIHLGHRQKVTVRDLTIFCRQFATMLNAGVTVTDSLSLIVKQTSNKKFSQVLHEVNDDILKGSSLSLAMAKRPDVFPTLLVSMIETGEVSGSLDTIMEDMAIHFEKEYKFNYKVKNALTYPVVVSVIAILVVVFLLTFVMPTFISLFDSFDAELPLPTRILMAISSNLKNYWFGYILVIAFVLIGFTQYVKTPRGKYRFDRFKMKMPIFGDLNEKVVMERFARTMSILLSSGVDILEAIAIVQRVVENEYISKELETVKEGVEQGYGLGRTLERTNAFPPLIYQMVDVGERSGTMDMTLEKIATFYEIEIEAYTEQLTTMIEPLIIVILGGIVGFIVVSMMLPIFNMYNIIQ